VLAERNGELPLLRIHVTNCSSILAPGVRARGRCEAQDDQGRGCRSAIHSSGGHPSRSRIVSMSVPRPVRQGWTKNLSLSVWPSARLLTLRDLAARRRVACTSTTTRTSYALNPRADGSDACASSRDTTAKTYRTFMATGVGGCARPASNGEWRMGTLGAEPK
jgi:hypothetical protein